MIDLAFKSSSTFLSRKRKNHFVLDVVRESNFKAWFKKQSKALQAKIESSGFKAPKGVLVLDNKILVGLGDNIGLYDFAHISAEIKKAFSADFLKTASFEIKGLRAQKDLHNACVGWGWAAYEFAALKTKQSVFPSLLWPKSVKKTEVLSFIDSVNILRNLVNMPANHLGPDELEQAVRMLSRQNDGKVKVIKDQALLDKNFPLIYTVGQASPRRPRLIEMTWGNARHPKVTIVGKGVVFDTGGLDLKPSQYMRLMKKDMGGAAHAIALSKLIIDHKLPVRLKLLIPAVENAVGGEAFRPGDIIKSRKGHFVENTNTDAEGRLILADTLTYASEEKPKLIIDFATLTGSARAALGPDVPAFFSNQDDLYPKIQKLSKDAEDAVWPMPLWQPYRKHIENSTGDLVNSAGLPGDLIYSALFLESFIENDTPWMHLDVFSWEQLGRAGRPKGAADTGMRAMFAYLQDHYG